MRADRGYWCLPEADIVRSTAVEVAQSQVSKAGATLATIKARMYASALEARRDRDFTFS